jgi:hypothetical protein
MHKKLINNKSNLIHISDVYKELLSFADLEPSHKSIVKITDKHRLIYVLSQLGPQINASSLKYPIEDLYELAIHIATGSIIIASKAYNITGKTYYKEELFESKCQSIAVYMPDSGVELVNLSQVGEIKVKPFVLRSESACTPSFLFGSDACNCASQWRCTQELAAYFNSNEKLTLDQVGFIMIYLESQNGMGVGFSQNNFSIDLTTKAHLRHAAHLSLGQKHNLSINQIHDAVE